MLDETGMLNLSVGDRDKYSELISALIPTDDIRQRTDLSIKHVNALTYLLHIADRYGCNEFGAVCSHFMTLRVSHDRKSRGELVTIFKRLFEDIYKADRLPGDEKLEEMLKEK